MMYRVFALAAALAVLPNCAAPRAGLVAGAVTAVAGGALLYSASHKDSERFDVVTPLEIVAEGTAGELLLAAGAALMVGGLIGLGQEYAATEKAAPAPLPVEPIAAPRMAPPGSATAALNGRVAQLSWQLHVEARAGHCVAATEIARRLGSLDADQLTALVERDDAVASCVALR